MEDNGHIVLETEQLAWAMIDQEISDAQFDRLEQLLRSSPEARRRYQQVLALDSQLHAYFAALRQPPQSPPGAKAA